MEAIISSETFISTKKLQIITWQKGETSIIIATKTSNKVRGNKDVERRRGCNKEEQKRERIKQAKI